MNFNRLSENNIQLRKENAALGAQLKARTDEKDAVEKDFAKFRTEANSTAFVLKGKLVSLLTCLECLLLSQKMFYSLQSNRGSCVPNTLTTGDLVLNYSIKAHYRIHCFIVALD